jgi:hypothetical protein
VTRPVINVIIDFSTGASFGFPFIIGTSQIGGADVLSDSAASLVVDVSNLLDSVQTNRGRNVSSEQFQTGTASIRILDQNGDFNPQNTSSPYYTYLNPMRKITITATYSGVTYPIFAGYITGYNTSTPKFNGDIVYTTVTAVDGFRLFQNAQFFGVTGAVAGETTGTRIGKILDTIGWPSTLRDIDTGLTTVQADPATQRTALAALQTCATTEYGAIYMDHTGRVAFQDRDLTVSSVAGTPVVFKDDGTAIGYFDVKWVFDDTQIYNLATITRTGGAVQTASDAASIAKFFTHSYNQSGLLMETDAEALDYAKAFIASRKDTVVRVDELTLDLQQDDYTAGTIAALTMDFFTPVSVTTTQPNNTTLSKTEQVFNVSHAITPNSWKVKFGTAEPIIDGFILDSTLYGILDTSVLSY